MSDPPVRGPSFASGDLERSPERKGDRYVANDHGTVSGITRAEWERTEVLGRLFAGGVMVFGGFAASRC